MNKILRVTSLLTMVATLAGCPAQLKTSDQPQPQTSGLAGYGQAPAPGMPAPSTRPPPPASAPSVSPVSKGTLLPVRTQPVRPRQKTKTEDRGSEVSNNQRSTKAEPESVKRTSEVVAVRTRVEGDRLITTTITKECEIRKIGNCTIQDHVQKARRKTNKLDILFVVDTSQSLFKEREEVVNGIDEFLAKLPRDTDYRLALMPAHGSTSDLSGRLYAPPGQPLVLKYSKMMKDQPSTALRDAFLDRFLRVPQDARESDRGELGLYSLTKALSFPRIKDIKEADFFRQDAALAVIFFADENDICAKYPPGVIPKPDPQNMEPVAKKRDCHGIYPKHIYQSLQLLKNNGMPFSVNGILYTEESQVNNSDRTDAWAVENEVGYGYLDLIRYSNGQEIPLNRGSIAQGLARIGEKVNLNLSTDLEFNIADKTYNDNEFEVYLDDVKQSPGNQYYYHKELRRIHMHRAGRDGSKIRIQYCAKP